MVKNIKAPGIRGLTIKAKSDISYLSLQYNHVSLNLFAGLKAGNAAVSNINCCRCSLKLISRNPKSFLL
jgi:hypothetical protein